ncbi:MULTISPECIES: hypothetical protein [Subtercola]|uniref:Peptidase M23 n=1 Tax=Subtercola vilae TaxID=2056433 RepID=A0A4T2C598_9MICO|nr:MULTISPECIES: hypothetical protein [Subtercola]MEA9985478.1 hypothetical protein [Subtercola sp. RTI3]TIH39300.1 hypothetical protein D4765_04270 [Subtercola vilae]
MRARASLIVAGAVLACAIGGTALVVNLFGSGSNPFASKVTSATALTCPAAADVTVGSITVPAGPVAGYCQAQLVNAAEIMNAGDTMGVGPHTKAIGVMTAMGESGLRNLDYGDAAGADSRGLFQQRDNGAWGTLADRMDPYTAAVNFFGALEALPDWTSLTPTEAAHAVQVNADPNYYANYFADAETVVTTLSGR